MEFLVAHAAINPPVEGLLAVVSEHFKTDGHLDTGLVERLNNVQLGEVMILIGVMLANQNDPIFFKLGNHLGHEHFFIILQIIYPVG